MLLNAIHHVGDLLQVTAQSNAGGRPHDPTVLVLVQVALLLAHEWFALGSERSAAVRRLTSLTRPLLYLAVAACGTYLVYKPTFDSDFEAIQTERGDGMLNHYILENSWLSLTDPDYCGSFVSPPCYYPARNTIWFSENLFGTAPLYWALRLALPYDLAYIWWQIVLTVLNFVAFALVARWLKLPHLLAIAGAFLFAFGAVHADQIKHSQMIPRMWMPLAAYYAIALVSQPSARALNRLLGCCFLQCLSCVYTGWFLAVGIVTFVPLMVALRRGAARALWRFAVEHRWRGAAVFGFWGAMMLLLFVPYVVANWGVARSYDECYNLMPTWSAWFTGPPGLRWDKALDPVRNRAAVTFECWLFCGFAIYVLMVAALVHLPFARRADLPEHWAAALAGLLTAVIWVALTMATALDGDSLWQYVRHFPGGQAIRCVSRVYTIVYMFGSLGALVWLTRVAERIVPWALARQALFALVLGAIAIEQTGFEQAAFKRADFYPIVDRSAEAVKQKDPPARLVYVVPRYVDGRGVPLGVGTGAYGEVFAMWVGLRANVPVVNGYSGRAPDDYPDDMPLKMAPRLREWLRGKYRGQILIVNPDVPGEKGVTTSTFEVDE
jgi:hypothetical protein